MNLIIDGGIVISDKVIKDGAVVIEGNRIVAVGSSGELKSKYPGYERIDAEGCAVLPGLINTHTHAAMSLLRGYAEGLTLSKWLNEKIWPIEARLKPRDIQLGAELAAYESLLFGCTTLNSMYFYYDEGSELHAFEKVGIRATVGHTFFEKTWEEGLKKTEEIVVKWHGRDDGRLRVSVCPHAPYSTGPVAYENAVRVANWLGVMYGRQYKIITHTHVAESKDECAETSKEFNVDTKEGIVSYMARRGFISPDTLVAHAIHLTDTDVELLKKYETKVSFNPVSNLKLGMGVPNAVALPEQGITVSLGTDGPASNNTLDMFETMKVISLLMKGLFLDPTLMPSINVFKYATENGGIALGYNDLGAIRPGYLADIILLDLKVPHAKPLYDIYDHLIFSARSSDVKTAIVNGRVVMENRRFPNVKLDRFFEEVERAKEDLLSRMEDSNLSEKGNEG